MANGVDLAKLAHQLQTEGRDAFIASWHALLKSIFQARLNARWRARAAMRSSVQAQTDALAAVAPLRAGALACSASLLRPSLPLVAACLVRSDSPRLLRNWRVCHPVVTDRCCAPAFLAGCGTRSARHAAPFFRDGRMAGRRTMQFEAQEHPSEGSS
jgi:hypothetical protein